MQLYVKKAAGGKVKVAVLSDTHDRVELIREAVELINAENVELTVHCGDFISPFSVKELRRLKSDFIGVFGNNDGEVEGLLRSSDFSIFKPPYEFKLSGFRFVVMHEPLFLEELAASERFDFLLYGHTHRVDVRRAGRSVIVNPGECCGYITGEATFAILNLHNREVSIRKLGSGNR